MYGHVIVSMCVLMCKGRQIESSEDVGGNEHDGCDQEEDAGDETGERKRVRQGRTARAEAKRAKERLREGLTHQHQRHNHHHRRHHHHRHRHRRRRRRRRRRHQVAAWLDRAFFFSVQSLPFCSTG